MFYRNIVILFLLCCARLIGQDLQIASSESVLHLVKNKEGLFLSVNGMWLKTDGVQALPEGILIQLNDELVSLNELLEMQAIYLWWDCPNCGEYNPHSIRTCVYCGADRFS